MKWSSALQYVGGVGDNSAPSDIGILSEVMTESKEMHMMNPIRYNDLRDGKYTDP